MIHSFILRDVRAIPSIIHLKHSSTAWQQPASQQRLLFGRERSEWRNLLKENCGEDPFRTDYNVDICDMTKTTL